MFKDNLQASPGPITSEDNLQVCLHLRNLLDFPGFMLRQLVSLTMLELPLSRDLDMDHILEIHFSSLIFTQRHAGLLLAKPPDPILKQHLEVLFLSMALPAQSEST